MFSNSEESSRSLAFSSRFNLIPPLLRSLVLPFFFSTTKYTKTLFVCFVYFVVQPSTPITYPLSPITHHLSPIIYHLSPIPYHLSSITSAASFQPVQGVSLTPMGTQFATPTGNTLLPLRVTPSYPYGYDPLTPTGNTLLPLRVRPSYPYGFSPRTPTGKRCIPSPQVFPPDLSADLLQNRRKRRR